MLRKIIKIDKEKCDGCGNCVPECHEGALQIIDGKARLISDLFCDGLGACLGNCPPGALTIEEREAEPYDERKVMDYIIKGGVNVITAHLKHLRDHEEFEYLREALEYLRDAGIENPLTQNELQEKKSHCGCPGSQEISIENTSENDSERGVRISHLRQWPVQLHLVSPHAAYFRNSDLLLAADCCGFAYPDFHKDFLKGKSLAIACPKLDSNKQVYLDKLITMINESNLRSITVLIMQVPCCSGLAQLAQQAIEISGSKIPVKLTVIAPSGEIIQSAQVS
jgi:NAD-dependent dihydropyrimidine dehydrogenase PreA subunit